MTIFFLSSFRFDEDGMPCVTFPRNFDHVVGLMDREDLFNTAEEDVESTDGQGNGGEEFKRAGSITNRANVAQRPPWTKYLLEEGLDRAKAFSRYKGMFAGIGILLNFAYPFRWFAGQTTVPAAVA